MNSTLKCVSKTFQGLIKLPSYNLTNYRCNSNRASIAKIGRLTYTRLYPTLLVQPDGSTINIRYHEPRKIIKLPLDISTLTEEQQQLRLLKRQPKERVYVEDEVKDKIDIKRYLKMVKSKSRRK